MKDIVISNKRIKREIWVFILCFVAAFGLNIYSIVKYKTEWSELIGQLPIVLLLAVVIYLLAGLLRLAVFGIVRLIQKK